jgi:lactate permease
VPVYSWKGLNTAGKSPSSEIFKLNWLTAAGNQLFLCGLLTVAALGVAPRQALAVFASTVKQLRWAILTVCSVLALAYVMNLSGQTITIGNWLAGAGAAFALLSPILGWLGVAVTGSDTSSNALFGALQVSAAQKADLSPMLMAAANSSGGVLGKMISPQNLAIGAAAVGMGGKEGDLFRMVVKWSLILLAAMVVIVYLQSTSVLSWMVVGS